MDRQPINKISSRTKQTGLFLLALVSFLLTSPHAFASADFNFPPVHQSSYSIEKYGTHVGDMHNELTQKNNQLIYTSRTKATGFASLFVKNDLVETSTLNWSGNEEEKALQQQSYDLFRGKHHKKNQKISFSWSNANTVNIQGHYKNRDYKLVSRHPVWGRHLIPLVMSKISLNNNSQQNTRPVNSEPQDNTFYITDKGGLQKYTYTLVKAENIIVSGKTYPALKFKISREGSRRMSYTWLSSAHYYLPVKIEQYEDGELNVSMQMTQFKTADTVPSLVTQKEVE